MKVTINIKASEERRVMSVAHFRHVFVPHFVCMYVRGTRFSVFVNFLFFFFILFCFLCYPLLTLCFFFSLELKGDPPDMEFLLSRHKGGKVLFILFFDLILFSQ
ncbi:hypothetical protein, unlikely [Trypanosoma brucei gambiense DAL972]|uniref:Uncharacterized protein n=1 Tax=Trypanosoma brucei gambiense (strain MHOM/CI/86/DAL972) TaxID=679716 RepID=D0A2J8_TRYB9|nr:hypothetical protein, unlikely [Trypanosoma brucei gambiense DAL972]CBH15492.1 hypothetical protein, unlikely [Trypanosoma brucei gambiense DAL972]|eukprot:XP_011777756.1 hypothetical protein, unlikely [Trypanosoma brucei gambiense DAL972]